MLIQNFMYQQEMGKIVWWITEDLVVTNFLMTYPQYFKDGNPVYFKV